MTHFSSEEERFGSAAFENEQTISRCMSRQDDDAFFVGFKDGKPCFVRDLGGILCVAGARGGKLRDLSSYNILPGICRHSQLLLDPKGEQAAISRDQTHDRKFCFYWNPCGLHGIGKSHLNPVDFLTIDSPSLVADTKVVCNNWIALSGSSNASYFEQRARGEFLEAIILTLVRMHGVLRLPDLYHAINLIPAGGNAWHEFAFEMTEAGFPISTRIEAEIAASRDDASGGFRGIIGELLKAFSCLSDPQLMESVSPPYDFSLQQMCDSDQRINFYMMCPAEYIEGWAPVIKAMFVAGMIYKSRAPSAPRQTWIIDEMALLKGFPLAVQLFTYGAGLGIRPVGIVQSLKQLGALAPDAEDIVLSSAATRIFFAVRDERTASAVSRMLGTQTLRFDDELRQARAHHARRRAVGQMLEGGDPFQAAIDLAYHSQEAELPSKQQRWLMTSAEVLNLPADKAIAFTDALDRPALLDRAPHYEQRFMAGRYHPNPYHPPMDRVRVKTRFGHAWKRVIREPVPEEFAHYPQYSDGFWSRIEK